MIEYIEIEGFKSIKKMQLELKPINILIGSNGSGKSNFISFFKLINAIFNERLQKFVIEEKADNLLYFGRKTTKNLFGKLIFDSGNRNNSAYYFNLSLTNNGELYIETEASSSNVNRKNLSDYFIRSLSLETSLHKSTYQFDVVLKEHLADLQAFHFHDTSNTSFLRKASDIDDNLYLKQDGRNLPSILYFVKTKHPKTFSRIEKTIKSVAPYIEKLSLEPNRLNEKEIELRWVGKEDSKSYFSAYHLSDGTLRFIALATLLMQPEPPAVMIIDEPELGLHPFAIGKLAGMIQAASTKSQIIAATQSPGLISNFSPEDIIVIDKSEEEKQTVFNRLNSESLNIWLQDFTLGDLWERNIINSAQPFTK